jgi:hypothetical protein
MNTSRKIKRTRKQTNNKTKKMKYGGVKKKPIKKPEYIRKDAILSADNVYRYRLERIWNEGKPKVLFIMLNPSTADALEDDPTIGKIVKFADRWGYGGVYVANLYAFRSAYPKDLETTADPIGPENREHIQSLLGLVDRVFYAWGNKKKEPEWLRELVKEPFCIALSTKRIPKHPLYLRDDSEPFIYLRDDACQGQAAEAAEAAGTGTGVEGE